MSKMIAGIVGAVILLFILGTILAFLGKVILAIAWVLGFLALGGVGYLAVKTFSK
jgi:uncharacterized metal-binding protein